VVEVRARAVAARDARVGDYNDNASERRDYASIQDLTNLASGVLGTPCEPS